MLIEFSVANYRSYLNRQTLSLAAGPMRNRREQNAFETGHGSVPRLLRSSAIYGPNAAGKSSLVQAMKFFKEFVINSAKGSQEGEEISVTPFRLSKKSSHEPSEFEIVFIENGNRYQYGFAVDEARVWEEWLFAVPQGKRTQRWFARSFSPDTGSYEWYINPTIRGNREVWKESTRDNALFLSTAVQLKSESLHQPFSWLQKHLRVISAPEVLPNHFSAKQCLEGQEKEKIINFLKAADLGIDDIIVKEKEVTLDELPDDMPEEFKKRLLGSTHFDLRTKHRDDDGDDIIFSMEEESDGTRVVFSLAGPWLDVLNNGWVVVVDDLHNTLHPHILRFLVGLFHDKGRNKNNAQLVFTSHDTSIMSGDFIGRDQLWFVEKNDQQATQLWPLLEYKPRKGEALERGYLGGRYGALPKIKELV